MFGNLFEKPKKPLVNVLDPSDIATITNLMIGWEEIEKELVIARTKAAGPYVNIYELLQTANVGNMTVAKVISLIQDPNDRTFHRLGEVMDMISTIFGEEKTMAFIDSVKFALINRGYEKQLIDSTFNIAPQLSLLVFFKTINMFTRAQLASQARR